MIRLAQIEKRFGQQVVLKGIDLTIDEGSVTALIGPSGSGKSTLLRCVNLLEIPQAVKTAEGTARDKYLQNKATEALAGHLAWRGLGTVESSDFGNRKLNIRILSPAPKLAVNAIKVCIREAKLDFTKMVIATAPYDGLDQARMAYPMPPKPFSLD